ncbi:MAG: lysophospholipid acyltransferase family protein, partial [Rhodospirillales bacterium]
MRPPTHYLKQALKSGAVQGPFCWLVSLALRLVHLTGRWTVEGDEAARAMWRDKKPFIACFWHNRLLMLSFAWNPPHGARAGGAPLSMLISAHQDGRLIARAIRHFGIVAVAGSDNRNTTSAMRALVRALRRGHCVGITPDSPPGPRMRAKNGVAVLARLAGVPVIPASYSCTRRRVLNTWDRLVL